MKQSKHMKTITNIICLGFAVGILATGTLTADAATIQVTVQTNLAGLAFTVDGATLQFGADFFLGTWFEPHHCHNFAAERRHRRSIRME